MTIIRIDDLSVGDLIYGGAFSGFGGGAAAEIIKIEPVMTELAFITIKRYNGTEVRLLMNTSSTTTKE